MPEPGWINIDVKGPALIYVSDTGVVHLLDRLPSLTPGVCDDRIPERDINLIAALWDTFTGTRRTLR